MNWLEASIEIPSEKMEEAYGILTNFGIEEVQIVSDDYIMLAIDERDWDYCDELQENGESKMIFYMRKEDEGRLQDIEDKISELVGFKVRLEKKILNEDQWINEWKKYFKPVEITDKIVIKPTWEEYTDNCDGRLIIEIDPGMAFGTGTHATTSMCIELLERYITPYEDEVLDMGCGSGILSIAAAKLSAKKITGIEVDPIAVEIAKKNIEINHLSDKIKVVQYDLTKGTDIKADIILANLTAELIVMLLENIKTCLKGKKMFIASGILIEKQEKVADELTKLNFEIIETMNKNEWASIAAKIRG